MVALSSGPPGGGEALSRGSSQSKTCHLPLWSATERYRRHLAESSEATATTIPTHASKAGLLADEQWERIRALLPTQEPGQGRPRRDDRQVLCGILWIMDTGSSWRDLPEEDFGPNSTVHGRYRKWCEEGLWSRIMEALGR